MDEAMARSVGSEYCSLPLPFFPLKLSPESLMRSFIPLEVGREPGHLGLRPMSNMFQFHGFNKKCFGSATSNGTHGVYRSMQNADIPICVPSS